jgi:STE24 endopeptidase
MTPETLFYIIIAILLLNFILESILDYLNKKHYDDPIPTELSDVYNEEEYKKSQAYKKENAKFGFYSSVFSLLIALVFLFGKGFAYVDTFVRQFSDNEIIISLLFFGILLLGSDILTTPFSYYHTFVIEEKYGFNKMDKKTFWLDKIKSWFLMIVIGGILLTIIVWFYQKTGKNFWIYTTIIIAVFSVFMTLFYSSLIVPLFNKQTPLKDGELKEAITNFAKKTGFKLDNIFVIDGSKRSTKANAYFSGFGAKKRIVLYDTLINDLNTDEIVAVLAHEIGHYKKKHVFINMIISIILTGFTLFLLSFFIDNKTLSEALSVKTPSFHIGLIAFALLYTPISIITNLITNVISRKMEYQADNYAKKHHNAKDLISGLKKLTKNSLSNLTPHKAYVFFHYSHPSLLQRVKNLIQT